MGQQHERHALAVARFQLGAPGSRPAAGSAQRAPSPRSRQPALPARATARPGERALPRRRGSDETTRLLSRTRRFCASRALERKMNVKNRRMGRQPCARWCGVVTSRQRRLHACRPPSGSRVERADPFTCGTEHLGAPQAVPQRLSSVSKDTPHPGPARRRAEGEQNADGLPEEAVWRCRDRDQRPLSTRSAMMPLAMATISRLPRSSRTQR